MYRKVALSMEVPSSLYHDISPLLDMHFVIATELTKNKLYMYHYKNRTDKKILILDNGTYEEGKPMEAKQLIELGIEIKANVVFAPDVLLKQKETLDLTSDFISLCKALKVPFNIGVIPQGDSPHDVVECYHLMRKLPAAGPIGLAFGYDRPSVLNILDKKGYYCYKWHHMLGLYNLDEIRTWPPYIWSMDTVKPLKAAKEGVHLEHLQRGTGKWCSTWELNPEKNSLLYRNISRLHQALTREV